MMWDYNEEHFIRYVNLEYWRENYEEIIKTGFEFPKIFISCIKHDYSVDKPSFQEIKPGHFVWANEKEMAEYRKIIK